MNTKETLNKVRTLLGIEVKLEQMTIDNGAIFEAEVFESGAEIFVVADDERVAVPVGEYEADGKIIVVAEEGIIAEIKEAESEEPVAEAEPVAEEEELKEETINPKKVVKSISEETFFSEIEKLRNEINELKLAKVEVEEVVEEKVELSAEPEVEGISHNPERVSDQKELHLYSQKSKQSILNTIFKTINN